MAKQELTIEEKEFKLDAHTLNRQLEFFIVKSMCMWDLRKTNKRYNVLREENDHATAFLILKQEMFNEGAKFR